MTIVSFSSRQKTWLKTSLVTVLVGTLLGACTSAERQSEEQAKVENQTESIPAVSQPVATADMISVKPETAQGQSLHRKAVGKVAPMVVNGLPGRPVYPPVEGLQENYQHYPENGVWTVAEQPLSTFSVDVDTASYANVRRMLNQGITPPKDAIRIEEMINYFNYQYPQLEGSTPFYVDTSMATSPLDSNNHVLRIVLSGKQINNEARAPSNLVFLLDVSGSMSADNKLPLLKRALTLLVNQLDSRDSVSIVVYAGSSGVVLEPTSGNDKFAIMQALEKLQAGGSTNGASGIQLAYQLARKAFKPDGVNRVLLATDGDFNVGTTDRKALMALIEKQRASGVNLSVLGFGNGNYNDHLTEQLADKGNGNAAYIDNINEARKVLVEQLTGTMQVIAKDVKIQVEFNPALVHEYRLIGYENRMLDKEDFNNDKVDAGEIGAGHTVTALYEVTLKNAKEYAIDELRYQPSPEQSPESDEIALVKLRYKTPKGDVSTKIERIVSASQIQAFENTDADFKFAYSVAGFGQLLKGSKFVADADGALLLAQAKASKGIDEQGYRAEFIRLMESWLLLKGNNTKNNMKTN